MNITKVSATVAVLAITLLGTIGCKANSTPSPTTSSAVSSKSDATKTRPTETVADPATGRLLVTMVMCDQIPGVDGFGINWCATDPDDPDVIELINTSCETLDAVDPNHSMSEAEINRSVTSALSLQAVSGDITMSEGESLATMLGAVLGGREEICS